MKFQGTTYPDVKLPCNRENMTKLVEALESGEYEQGQAYLLTITGDGKRKFCCLGVACEISGLGKWNANPENPAYVNPENPAYVVSERDHSRASLPDAVESWLGVSGNYLPVSGGTELGDVIEASSLNDATFEDHGETYGFKAIAAQIRKVYLTD